MTDICGYFLDIDNMQILTFISYNLYIYSYKYDHQRMLSWLKMIKIIIFKFKKIFLIFHDLMSFYENFRH